MGEYIETSWELFTNYKGRCVPEEIGEGIEPFLHKILEFKKLGTSGEEGRMCKYYFWFRAYNCGDQCTD